MTKVVRMDIKEFRNLGYLQEINRQFLHPLGLALEIAIEEDGTEHLSSIWDFRTDEEGMRYGLDGNHRERIRIFRERAAYVAERQAELARKRTAMFGYVVEPIP